MYFKCILSLQHTQHGGQKNTLAPRTTHRTYLGQNQRKENGIGIGLEQDMHGDIDNLSILRRPSDAASAIVADDEL